MQNSCKFLDVYFVTSRRKAIRLFNSPRFKQCRILSENLLVVYMAKREVKLDSLIPIGMAVLCQSKTFMSALWVKELQPRLSSPSIAYSDTDSYIIKTKAATPEEALMSIEKVMDFSNLEPTHPLYSPRKALIPGFLKDEMALKKVVLSLSPRSSHHVRFLCCRG